MGNLNMEARQIHYRHDDTMTVDNKLLNLEGRVATLEDGEPAEVSKVDIAPVFSAESAYSAGDYVYHEGHLYKFTADHAAGPWSELDTETAVVTADLTDQAGDIDQLKSGLTNVNVALSVPENAGKNLITMTLSDIKSSNTSGTWADNVYTLDGLTFTVLTDSDGNVIGVKANGPAPANDTYFTLGHISFVKDTSYRMTSGTTGSTAETYRLWAYSSTAFPVGHRLSTDSNCGENVARDARANEICPIAFMIMAGYAPDNITVYPMVRLASVSDPTFAPYIPSVESRIEAVEKGNVSHEMLKSSTSVWSGDTLTFTVAPENNRMWRLVAGVSYSLGSKFVEAYIVIRTGESGVFTYNAHGTVTATYDYTTGVLTVTLPESSHWIYRMELAAAYYD